MANNIGIHPRTKNYKGFGQDKCKSDKYGDLIVEHNIINNQKKTDYDSLKIAMETDVLECNFIRLWDKNGEDKICTCGGQLKYINNLIIKFHINKKESDIQVPGKYCLDCNCKYVVKNILYRYFFPDK